MRINIHFVAVATGLALAAPHACFAGRGATYGTASLTKTAKLGSFTPQAITGAGVSLGTLVLSKNGNYAGNVVAAETSRSATKTDWCASVGDESNQTDLVAVSQDAAARFYMVRCWGYEDFLHDGTNNSMTVMRFPNSVATYANGVNAAGLVAGEFETSASGADHGFYLVGATYVAFDPPGATDTYVTGVGDQNTIFGSFYKGFIKGVYPYSHGFLLDQFGNYTILDPPGSSGGSAVSGMNANNQVAGTFSDGFNNHAFFWQNGTFTNLTPPNAVSSEANAINDAGEVAGDYVDTANVTHGFVSQPSSGRVIYFVAPSGLYLGRVTAINNTHAQVTGYNEDADSNYVPFIATCRGTSCF